ncbi:VPS9 domain-containing protein 1-like [Megalops cyprinoides]|uniref:VPS9 domain-containing protein 1-like n=1 Tax=Megalops cyprinoides TaxID=118141 RepID=UPI001864ACC3|nr:VPS9 domain-containing protein 1-like [Megalops cyprinoides]
MPRRRSETPRDLRVYWKKLKAFLKTLSLQRQMMENLIIAKARQDALHRKMEERRLRLQEEANRRFAGSGLITPEEQEQRLLYANILEYEQDHDWPKLWKANLRKNPGDATLVAGLLSYLLSCPDHPVMKLLKRLQYRVYNRLYPIVSENPAPSPAPSPPRPIKPSRSAHSLGPDPPTPPRPRPRLPHSQSEASLGDGVARDLNANEEDPAPASEAPPPARPRDGSFEDLERYLATPDLSPAPDSAPEGEADAHLLSLEERALKEHLRTIVKDVHNAIDRLLSLCLLSFECLNTASSKDVCLASIEEAFFSPLWRPLLALFRKVHRDREQAFEAGAGLYRNATPGDVGVAPTLYPADPAAGSYPYEAAVTELQRLPGDTCPHKKLECIVRTLRLICVCAEEYRALQDPEAPPSTAAIGADDLLPILSFVALRSALPQLVSECAALEEFIHEGYLIGEEGYCLTSMQSALSYVESLGGASPHR